MHGGGVVNVAQALHLLRIAQGFHKVQHQRVDELLHLFGGSLHGLRAFAESLRHHAVAGEFLAVALDQHLRVERFAVDFAQAFFQSALKGVGGISHGDEVAAQGVERLVVHDGSALALHPGQRGAVENQYHLAVARDGGALVEGVVGGDVQWLDHRVFGAHGLGNHQQPLLDENALALVFEQLDRAVLQQLAEIDVGHDAVAIDLHHQPTGDGVHLLGVDGEQVFYGRHRQGVGFAPQAEIQHRQHGHGERQLQREGAALAQRGVDVDAAAQRGDGGAHHIHADAAAGEFADLLFGGEAGQKDEFEHLALRQSRGFLRGDDAFGNGVLHDFLCIHAATIVAHLNLHLVAQMAGEHAQHGLLGLAGLTAYLRLFDAVVERVAHQVNERAGERIDHGLVDFHVFALDVQPHFFTQAARGVAHHPGQALEQALARLHAQAHDGVLQVVDGEIGFARQPGQGFVFLRHAGHGGAESVAQQHEFADLVHRLVEPGGIDADGAFFGGAAVGRACRRCRGLGFLRGFLRNFGRWRAGLTWGVASAVNLVEHALELVLGDLVVGTAGRCRNGASRCRARRLACAVEVVEHALEFVLGDGVAVCGGGGGGSGLGVGGAAFGKQPGAAAVAFGLRDPEAFPRGLGRGSGAGRGTGRLGRFLGHFRQRGRFAAGESLDVCAQCGRAGGGIFAARHVVEHGGDDVGGAQDGVDHRRGGAQFAAAHFVEQVFEMVAPVHHVLRFEKTGAALEGVEGAEDGAERFAVVGLGFQPQQLVLGLAQQLARFGEKFQQDVVVHDGGAEGFRCRGRAAGRPRHPGQRRVRRRWELR